MIVLRVQDWRSLVSGLYVELSAARHPHCSSLCVPEIVDSPSLLLSLSSRLLPFVSPNGPSIHKDYRCDPSLSTLLLSWHPENKILENFMLPLQSLPFSAQKPCRFCSPPWLLSWVSSRLVILQTQLICGDSKLLLSYVAYESINHTTHQLLGAPDLLWFTQALPRSMPFIVGAFASWRAVGG